MAVFYIDTSTSATATIWDQISEIDGREYVLVFAWNDRYQSWYLHILDQDSNPILYGRRLAVGVVLGRQLVGDSRIWPGKLVCVATTQDPSDPGQFDLGSRVLLVYDDLQPIVP